MPVTPSLKDWGLSENPDSSKSWVASIRRDLDTGNEGGNGRRIPGDSYACSTQTYVYHKYNIPLKNEKIDILYWFIILQEKVKVSL